MGSTQRVLAFASALFLVSAGPVVAQEGLAAGQHDHVEAAPIALEPAIDEQTMRLHHDKHHLAYVNGLNSALAALAKAREEFERLHPELLANVEATLAAAEQNKYLKEQLDLLKDAISGPVGKELDSFAEKMLEIEEQTAETVLEIEELEKIKNPTKDQQADLEKAKKKLKELGTAASEAAEEHHKAMAKIVYDMATVQAQADGVITQAEYDALDEYARRMGIVDQSTLDAQYAMQVMGDELQKHPEFYNNSARAMEAMTRALDDVSAASGGEDAVQDALRPQIQTYKYAFRVGKITNNFLYRSWQFPHQSRDGENLVSLGKLWILQKIDDLNVIFPLEVFLADGFQIGKSCEGPWCLPGDIESQFPEHILVSIFSLIRLCFHLPLRGLQVVNLPCATVPSPSGAGSHPFSASSPGRPGASLLLPPPRTVPATRQPGLPLPFVWFPG